MNEFTELDVPRSTPACIAWNRLRICAAGLKVLVIVSCALACESRCFSADDGPAITLPNHLQPHIVDPRNTPTVIAAVRNPYQVALQPLPGRTGAEPLPAPADQTLPSPAQPVLQQPLPPPSVFGPEQIRLPLLDAGGKPVGATPQPTPQVREQFQQYVERTIDPENTLDLVQSRPRLLMLRQAPIRVQIADENVASYTLIAETELSVVGNGVGSTILNLWFAPPQKDAPPTILSYLVRVMPDPEQKERLERVYKALEAEINHTFPDSAIHLSLAGDKLVVSGEAKDVVEATHILQIVSANAPGGNRNRNGYQADEIPVSQINVVAQPSPFGAQAQLPEQGLQNFLLRNLNRNVINLLHVPGEQQVMLRVSVAEVNRTAARSIGMDFSIANDQGINVFSQLTNLVSSGGTGLLSSGANLPAMLDNGQVTLAIRA